MPSPEPSKPGELSIRVTDSEGGTVVCLSGRISIESSPELRACLVEILNRKSLPTIVIELGAVSSIDLSGIATLVEALKIARKRRTALRLRGLRGSPRYLFEVTGLMGLFETQGQLSNPSRPKAM